MTPLPLSQGIQPTRFSLSHLIKRFNLPRLTLFGRSVLLLASELLANAICWIVAGILFGRNKETQPILSLALLAWTIGLRHGTERVHDTLPVCSAIDNATRSLMNMGQLPVTCGLYFSLGHSTIVIAVNVAIAISTSVYDRIDGVGNVGGIVGASVSATFLFIVGLANSIILVKIIRKRRALKRERASRIERGEDPRAVDQDIYDHGTHGNTLMMKIIGPVVTFVNKPWKMYPVGVLFGFGFDTASSIALLAVSAIAKKGSDGKQIPPGHIVILPLLFTAGMTLIDSVDSILMLYSYSGFPERSFALWERRSSKKSRSKGLTPIGTHIPGVGGGSSTGMIRDLEPRSPDPLLPASPAEEERESSYFEGRIQELPITGRGTIQDDDSRSVKSTKSAKSGIMNDSTNVATTDVHVVKTLDDEDSDADAYESEAKTNQYVKRNAMSGLSVLLTLMSILVAFSISLITIMGLIGDNCTQCREAAEAEDGGGLAGRWWRGWARANDASGYIGAAIVGSFVFVVASWYGLRALYRKWKARKA